MCRSDMCYDENCKHGYCHFQLALLVYMYVAAVLSDSMEVLSIYMTMYGWYYIIMVCTY